MSTTLYVGADIAAATVSLYWQDPNTQQATEITIKQTRRARQALVQRLTQLACAAQIQVVMEATGSYWMNLADALHQAGIVVSVLNPSQVHHFARARLMRAKTDRLDACLLREYGQVMQPPAWVPPPAVCQQVTLLLNRRDDLLKIRTAERNRLHALKQIPHLPPGLLDDLQQHIRDLTAQATRIEQQIRRLMQAVPAWATAIGHLLTVKGLGLLTIARILTTTHAFARCQSAAQAAAFAGLAPQPRESGAWKGRRSVGAGGHAALRSALYMSALSSVRYNPLLRDFYARLCRAGKPKKLALCAVARKLICIAWALVVKQQDFDPILAAARPAA